MKAQSKDELVKLTRGFRANELTSAAPPVPVKVIRAATGCEPIQEAALNMTRGELS